MKLRPLIPVLIVSAYAVACDDTLTEPDRVPAIDELPTPSQGRVPSTTAGSMLYPCFRGLMGEVAAEHVWVPVPVASHRAAGKKGLVDLEFVAPHVPGIGRIALHCTVPNRPDAMSAARTYFSQPLIAMDVRVTRSAMASRGDDPPPEEEEEEEDPPSTPPPDDGGSGSYPPGSTPDWDPYFAHEEGQVRQACDSPPGKAYDGAWYTCTVHQHEQRELQVGSIIRGNIDAHPYCDVIADEWGARHAAGQIGWWSETVPVSGGIELGHYHDETSVAPVEQIHIFEGNSQHPRTISGLVRTAVHETLHALDFRHDDVVTGSLKFRNINAICAAVEDRG